MLSVGPTNSDDKLTRKPLALKVCVLGDVRTGKTSLIHAACNNLVLSNKYKETVGVEWEAFHHDDTKLTLFDISGKERFQSMTENYVRNSSAGIICYDPTIPSSYNAVNKWLNLFRKGAGSDAPVILISTKSDLDSSSNEGKPSLDDKKKEIGAILKYNLSAKNPNAVKKAFNDIAETLFNLHYKLEPIKMTVDDVLPIYRTLYLLSNNAFKKHDAWIYQSGLSQDKLLEQMKALPESSLTHKAIKLHKEYYAWNRPDNTALHDAHFTGIYNAMRAYIYEQNSFKKKPFIAFNKAGIEKRASEKPHSDAKKFLDNMTTKSVQDKTLVNIAPTQIPRVNTTDKYQFKIILIGGEGVGKTQLLNRLCNNQFSEKYLTPGDLDFKTYEGDNFILNISLLPNQALYSKTNYRDQHTKNADLAVICYDPFLPSPVKRDIACVRKLLPSIRLVLMRTKTDLHPEYENENLANECGTLQHFSVSAKQNSNSVISAFNAIGKELVASMKHDTNLDEQVEMIDQQYANDIKRIYSTIRLLKLFNKKAQAWTPEDCATTADLLEHAERDYSDTAKAIELDAEFYAWKYPESKDHKEHYVGLYNAIRTYTHSFFQKTPYPAHSIDDIKRHAKKNNSATAIYEKTLNGNPNL